MTTSTAPVGPYVLPPLRYAFDAFVPILDEAMVAAHHEVHHRGAVDALNAWLALNPSWQGLTIEALLRRLADIAPEEQPVLRLHGGGHANHQFFWKILTPTPQHGPSGALAQAIERDFGSYASMRAQFEAVADGHGGPGWVFLVCRPRQAFRLEILALDGNDSVLTQPEPAPGLLLCDLWEHAYEPRYAHRRADWVRSWGCT